MGSRIGDAKIERKSVMSDTKKRTLKVAERCNDCKKPVDDCICRECVFCDDPVSSARDIKCCETAKCKEPFVMHRKCLTQRLAATRRLRIKCTACNKTTTFQDNTRRPIWEAYWFCNPIFLTKLSLSLLLLSTLPYLLVYYFVYYFGDADSIGERSWAVSIAVSWVFVGIFYVAVKIIRLIFRIATWPARKIFSSLRGTVHSTAEQEDAGVSIVAYKDKDS